jgi:hypothetical protein
VVPNFIFPAFRLVVVIPRTVISDVQVLSLTLIIVSSVAFGVIVYDPVYSVALVLILLIALIKPLGKLNCVEIPAFVRMASAI